MIKKQMNYEGEIIWDKKMPVGPNRRKISIQLARKKINFDPKFSLQEGIKNTVDFYVNSKKYSCPLGTDLLISSIIAVFSILLIFSFVS